MYIYIHGADLWPQRQREGRTARRGAAAAARAAAGIHTLLYCSCRQARKLVILQVFLLFLCIEQGPESLSRRARISKQAQKLVILQVFLLFLGIKQGPESLITRARISKQTG